MKIKNKIIALMISLIAMPTFALAKDGPYIGAKYAKIDVDYKTIDGVDLNQVFPTDFNALDLHVGYNLGNGFFEFGAGLFSSTENIKKPAKEQFFVSRFFFHFALIQF